LEIHHQYFTAKLPKTTYNEDTGQTICSRKVTIPLQLQSLPLSASFGIFDSYVEFKLICLKGDPLPINFQRSHLLTDPTSFEEPLLETFITVVIDEKGSLNSVIQSGLATIGGMSGEQVVAATVAAAKKRCADVRNCIELGQLGA
jgi:exosome complex component RRP43